MDLKRLISQFVYKIEPKPEGGFIARASDPANPPLEAATRQELQKKIQQKIAENLSSELPALKLIAEGKTSVFAYHIEHKPDGGFALHSSDPNAGVIEAGTMQEVESRFLEKFLGSAAQRLMPELAQALAGKEISGDVKVVVNRKTSFTINHDSKKAGFGNLFAPTSGLASSNSPADGSVTANIGTVAGSLDSSPIVPESSKSWKVFAILLAVLVAGVLFYFLGR